MKKILSTTIAISLLTLATTTSFAKKDDVENMLQSYLPKLQEQWMEVRIANSYFSGKYTLPREYVAVTNLNETNHGVVTLHIRKDYPDDSAGYASLVNTYFVDCKHGKQRYVGVTMYDTLGNIIGQKFADQLNKVEQPYAFTESPQGHYCSGELIINLLTQGGFLSAQDQAVLDRVLLETRDHQTQAIQDKNLEIPKVDIKKYQQLVEQEQLEKPSEEQ
ncbi:MAG: hypothetical protein SFU55_08640 [Methylophilus sp.]|nr:hypothetical protein [Methylophilus sp.]